MLTRAAFYLNLNLNLYLYLNLLKIGFKAFYIKGLRPMGMATETNWPFGTVSGHTLTIYMTTGPVCALPGSKY